MLSFCLCRCIISLSSPCLLHESRSPVDHFSEVPWPSGFQMVSGKSLSKVGEREDGEVMACFPLAPSLPSCSFLLILCLIFFTTYIYSFLIIFSLLYLKVWRGPWYLHLLSTFRPQKWQRLSAVASFKAIHRTFCRFPPLPLLKIAPSILSLIIYFEGVLFLAGILTKTKNCIYYC